MKKSILLFILSLVIPLSLFAQISSVKTPNGKLKGYKDGKTGVFKGIPFAAPPTGENRWKAPQPLNKWTGSLLCNQFGPSPIQGKPQPFMYWSSEFLIPEEPISEDCLYLNVWTNAKSAKEKRPVLVYIYGGGFRSGGSACPIYDGQAMAQKGVVFVSINYRVGVFGFLAHPELSAESDLKTSGNYALLDMIEALKWVKQNIKLFGGDPNNVTIAGQSAGAFAVNYLTVSPLAKGLFHKAIAQSGGSFLSSPGISTLSLRAAETQGEIFSNNLGVKTLKELRSLTSDQILESTGGISWPIVDGKVITNRIIDVYGEGKQTDVPLLIGWNSDDRVIGTPASSQKHHQNVQTRFGDFSDEVLELYPANDDTQAAQAQSDMNRDETFGVQVFTWGKMQNQTGKSPVYIYNFNRKLPYHTEESNFGAFHSAEIVYAYNNLHTLNRPWESFDKNLASLMSDYWSNFAKTGNPNGPGLPQWDQFNVSKPMVMILDKGSLSMELPTLRQMSFWEKYMNK